jgi:hypothetical protein
MDDLQTGVVGATTLLPPGHDTDDDDNSVADIGIQQQQQQQQQQQFIEFSYVVSTFSPETHCSGVKFALTSASVDGDYQTVRLFSKILVCVICCVNANC